jgi:hypothetical protein
VRPDEPKRAARRHQFDDPGVGPSHAPLAAAGADYEDIRHRLETILQEVPKGLWSRIQDQTFLEQCVGVPPPWRAIVQRALVVFALMSGRLSSGQEGPAGGGPPPLGAGGGGSPPLEGGASGSALEAS